MIVGVLAGVVAGVLLAQNAVNSRNYQMMNMMGMRGTMQDTKQDSMMEGIGQVDSTGMSMGQMSSVLATLRGEEFDREFIRLMIEHHEGALDMAELVLLNSDRVELKDLANDIISAQTKEINLMRGWQETWFK